MVKLDVIQGKKFYEETLEAQREYLLNKLPKNFEDPRNCRVEVPFVLHKEIREELAAEGWEYRTSGINISPTGEGYLFYQPRFVEEAVRVAVKDKDSQVKLDFVALPAIKKAMSELGWAHQLRSSTDCSIQYSDFYYDEDASLMEELEKESVFYYDEDA